jgi:alkylated DNA repair dioxygenase AlkB
MRIMPSASVSACSKDLFGPSPAMPEGLRYQDELFSSSQEQAFLRIFAGLPFKPFEFQGYLGNRRIVSYGFRYDYAGRALRAADDMPGFLEPLCEIASGFSHIPKEQLRQALVTEYAPGAGIGWHKDKPMFEKVVALSFGSSCVLRLRRPRAKGWDRFNAKVAPRSGYLLSGEARDGWQHSIAPMDTPRYSVTIRSFRPDWKS